MGRDASIAMTGDLQFLLAVIFIAAVLFASGRVRFDVVASLVIISLSLGGILTTEEAFAGFGSPVVVLVACLFIVGEMLTRTGVAYAVGEWLARLGGGSEWRLIILLMCSAALLGCIMSSTAVVAALIPAVLQVGRESGLHVSRLLLPLSYAALLSGMLILLAAIPNLIVNAQLQASGYPPFGLFDITPIGLVVLAVAVLYMLLLGRYLLPQKPVVTASDSQPTNRDLMNEFGLVSRGSLFSVPGDSLLVGLKIKDSLFMGFNARILLVQRYEVFGESIIANPSISMILKPGDNILLAASEEVCDDLAQAAGLERRGIRQTYIERWEKEAGNAVVMVHAESNLVGRSLSGISFSDQYGVHVLAVKRRGEILPSAGKLKLEAGDALLAAGGWDQIGRLQFWPSDFVLLSRPVEAERYIPQRRKAPIALAIFLGMIVLSASGVVPLVIAVLLAVGAGIVSGCIAMDDTYQAIPWNRIVLIAGMLPVAVALQNTGGVDLAVKLLVDGVGQPAPLAMLSALFFLSAGLGLLLSSVATAVLLTPIAIRAAEVMGVEPYAFAMTVAVAASTTFITPYSAPAMTLVVEPGGYRFVDFLKLGVPLLFLVWVVTIAMVPILLPF
jgi:di/tricarboxylate transporter